MDSSRKHAVKRSFEQRGEPSEVGPERIGVRDELCLVVMRQRGHAPNVSGCNVDSGNSDVASEN